MRHRILIVDDSPTARVELAEAFEKAEFEVVPCESVAEARTALRRELPDMVILDVVLPDGDGIDRLGELRSAAETTEPDEERAVLLRELATKNRELELLNDELQMFAYSVSHDLQQPLRAMDGFSKAALESYGDELGEEGRHFLNRIRAGADTMRRLIGGLLTLSRVTRRDLEKVPLRLDIIAHDVIERLRDADPDRDVVVEIAEPLEATGDPHLVESLLERLLGNAWKFSSKQESARIELGVDRAGSSSVFFVKDNGAGFDMQYADALFAPFQRQHSEDEFPGTGIGLATAQRIVRRHGGDIRAEAARDEGATFYFTLALPLETEWENV